LNIATINSTLAAQTNQAMAALYRLFVANKLSSPQDTSVSFTGKNIIVTGSNTGLGYETALKYVQKDAATVILAVRSLAKGEAAKKAIESKTRRKGVVRVWELDMGDYDSIQAFADKAAKELDHLDIAVLNAGVYSTTYQESRYGFEQDLQVNTVSTALLALLLLPKLRESKSTGDIPVLEIVASGRYVTAKFSPEELDAESLLLEMSKPDKFQTPRAYSVSKLFVMYAMRQLASLAHEDGEPEVIVNAVCPGFCMSDLARGHLGDGLFKLFAKLLMNLFLRSTENGARLIVSGTTLGVNGNGQFWQNDTIAE
jgi:NAD(P)-dependent dehydrogenase (short-subunit alcohol dehydrogenase family)